MVKKKKDPLEKLMIYFPKNKKYEIIYRVWDLYDGKMWRGIGRKPDNYMQIEKGKYPEAKFEIVLKQGEHIVILTEEEFKTIKFNWESFLKSQGVSQDD